KALRFLLDLLKISDAAAAAKKKTARNIMLYVYISTWALKLFLVFLLQYPVFFIVSPAYLEELLTFLVSP
ncbi:hypothetical protein, partial [Mordavella massiliensis]|uniref:hypothetical protein n=1 Tax=Mordavella massiliensis TaxID=1871024 RepID=UPI00195C2DDB